MEEVQAGSVEFPGHEARLFGEESSRWWRHGRSDEWHFREPLSLAEMENLSHRTFAANTEKKILWAVQLYRNWWYQRCAKVDCDSRIKWASIDNLGQVSRSNLAFALCAFISEVKKLDGSEFPGSSLYQIIICIQFHIEKNGMKVKLLDDPSFVKLRFTLDNRQVRQT